MSTAVLKIVRPDAKGRITLGELAQGISGFEVTIDKKNRIILEPKVEISVNEKWLFDNKIALNKVKQGLQDSAAGRLTNKGSFAKYANQKLDE